MGIFDSIMGNNKPAPVPAAPVAPAVAPEKPVEPVNPLDVYKNMFDTSKNAAEDVAPAFKLDDKVLNEVSGKLQFASGVNPELMQRAQGGDVNALIEMMNAVAQNAYKAAISHGTALTDTHLNSRAEYEKKTLGSKVKEQLISSQLADVPNANHPVVKAELARIASMLAKQNPDASAEQIKTEAVRYLKEVQAAMNPTTESQQTQKTAGEIDDWEAFLTS